jgi:succinoglycan biosynthesis transport protein ExoP
MSSDDSTSIDVGSWFTTLARNWWVIVGLVVIGIVVGAVVTLAQPKEYTATSSVYIGQTTDANGNPMAGLNSNAKAAVQLLASQVVLKEAAERTGMDISASALRKSTTVETPSSTVKTTTSVVNIIVISVTDTDPERAAAAANALAEVLLERIDIGVSEKIAVLEDQLAADVKAYEESLARSAQAQEAIADIAAGGGSAGEKATAAASWVALAQAAATEQESLNRAIQDRELLLLSARQNEEPRLLHEAGVPDSPSGPQMTMNVAIGALAGLVIGVIVAFARRGLAERRAARAAA